MESQGWSGGEDACEGQHHVSTASGYLSASPRGGGLQSASARWEALPPAARRNLCGHLLGLLVVDAGFAAAEQAGQMDDLVRAGSFTRACAGHENVVGMELFASA